MVVLLIIKGILPSLSAHRFSAWAKDDQLLFFFVLTALLVFIPLVYLIKQRMESLKSSAREL
ncbi:MAG: hypothetical protein WCJ81_08045 [bacterium]